MSKCVCMCDVMCDLQRRGKKATAFLSGSWDLFQGGQINDAGSYIASYLLTYLPT